MSSEKIVAEVRTEFGKGAARRLRRDNKIPAVIYGHGSEATHVALPAHDTTMALRHHGKSAVLELQIDGKAQLALTKQIQVDDIRRVIEHIDFVAVKAGEKVQTEVPVHVTGTTQPGTMTTTEHASIVIEAEATHVPEVIEVSVDGLGAGQFIHAGDVVLPQGATLVSAADTIIVHVTEPQSHEQDLASAVAEAEAQAEASAGPVAE
jgi:large subunit ribosomal protein L25